MEHVRQKHRDRTHATDAHRWETCNRSTLVELMRQKHTDGPVEVSCLSDGHQRSMRGSPLFKSLINLIQLHRVTPKYYSLPVADPHLPGVHTFGHLLEPLKAQQSDSVAWKCYTWLPACCRSTPPGHIWVLA
eukprot:1152406-Pelagomonas_calceolata.AAC.4